jgi:hypothetical protein
MIVMMIIVGPIKMHHNFIHTVQSRLSCYKVFLNIPDLLVLFHNFKNYIQNCLKLELKAKLQQQDRVRIVIFNKSKKQKHL